MPVSQVLNPKGIIKKQTNNDLPFSPAQPVIASSYSLSTSSQTVVNLPFSIQTTGASANTDIFWLFVDGKKLDLGTISTNDYYFSSVAADGSSSQVTLNQSLAINLNIQAFKLGLKKESEFQTDNRFVSLYSALNAGFQGFIDTSTNLLAATSTAGTPAAGTFYSTVSNRASIPDLSQDVKSRMGIERVPTQQMFAIQNEAGSNGEAIYGVLNDAFGQIRFVGNWVNFLDASGARPRTVTTNDFVEITFYGTGLNILNAANQAGIDARASTDGGSEGANIFAASYSSLLDARNYASNQIVPVISGLTLGIHTVKIRSNATTAFNVFGFEILNLSSNVITNPGLSYNKGQQITSSLQSSIAYNASVTGTRGGRVITYQNADGTIGQVFRAANTSSATLASADHTNEEIAKVFSWREFGAGRADDFSLLNTTPGNKAFTLEDGTTTLMGNTVVANNPSALCLSNTINTSFVVFTFVGTGLDVVILAEGAGLSHAATVVIDGGSSVGTISTTGTSLKTQKIVSGLPYGTHTVKLATTVTNTANLDLMSFIVYQPKKPVAPTGSIELADYNVMANYDSSAVTGTAQADAGIPQGTLVKTASREFLYTGANWAINVPNVLSPYGQNVGTTTNNGQPATYTFFGTGFMFHGGASGGGTFDFTVTIDGSLNTSGVAKTNASNLGAGSYRSTSSTGDSPIRIEFTGLSLGLHTVVINRTAGTGNGIGLYALELIVPIHSYRSNIYADISNTLPIGSMSMSDSRKFSAIKEGTSAVKSWSQAVGVVSSPTTTSSTYVPAADMSCVIKTSGGRLRMTYDVVVNSSSGNTISLAFYVDGVQAGNEMLWNATTNAPTPLSNTVSVQVAPGTHKVDVYMKITGGVTLTLSGTQRNLLVEEV